MAIVKTPSGEEKYRPDTEDKIEIKPAGPDPNAYGLHVNGEKIGHAHVAATGTFLSSVQIDDRYQGQGLGKKFYAGIEQHLGHSLMPSPLGLSDKAANVWKSRTKGMSDQEKNALAEKMRTTAQSYGLSPKAVQTDVEPRIRKSLFEHFLLEYLTANQREDFSQYEMTEKARTATDPFFGKDVDHKREELSDEILEKSEVHKKVEEHLGQQIHPNDYRKGMVKDKYGRDAKLGKLIKDDKLRAQFAADNTRAGGKAVGSHYMTVVRGVEVAGQTNPVPDAVHPTGHSWAGASCKNLVDGVNRHYLPGEIENGTVVVRAHDQDGKEIYRAALQPGYNNAGKTAYQVNSEYGVKNPQFQKHAHDVAARLSEKGSPSDWVHKIPHTVYNDNYASNEFLNPGIDDEGMRHALNNGDRTTIRAILKLPNLAPEHLSAIWNKHFTTDPKKYVPYEVGGLLGSVIEHPNVPTEHLVQAVESGAWNLKEKALAHPRLPMDLLNKAIQSDDGDTIHAGFNNPQINASHIETALKSKNRYTRQTAIGNAKATPEQLDRELMNETDPRVLASAANNPNVTLDTLARSARRQVSKETTETGNSVEDPVITAMLKRPDHTSEHVGIAMTSHRTYDRVRAASSRMLANDQIDPLIKDPSQVVRNTLANNWQVLGTDHIGKLLQDPDTEVRESIIHHPKVTAEQLHEVLLDPDESLYMKRTALIHGNMNETHIATALQSSNFQVRMRAIIHPKITEDQLKHHAENDPEPAVRNTAQDTLDNLAYSRRHAAAMKNLSGQGLAEELTKGAGGNIAGLGVGDKGEPVSTLLKEYITDSQRKQYSRYKMTPKARADTDHFFGAGMDHKQEPVPETSEKSEVHKKVETHLGKTLTPEEYKTGLHQDKYGRSVKIGKSISDPNLRLQFAADNTRAGVKSGGGQYSTIVRGTEVAGQTNPAHTDLHPKGHSWAQESCKNIEDGSNKRYIPQEIKNGTVVGFVHDHEGKEIYRATLHPHHNEEGHTVYAVDGEYGIKHPAYRKHMDDVASRLSGEYKPGVFRKSIHVYNDTNITHILHPNATAEDITSALKDKDRNVRIAAIQHPNATAEHITTGLKDDDHNVRVQVIQHPNATAEHITQAMKDKAPDVRHAAVQHPKATAEHITTGLKDDNSLVRVIALRHPKATAEHITTGLKDDDHNVRIAAIRHPNATVEHITQAMKDDDHNVRIAAVQHPKATEEHITKALNSNIFSLRLAATQHPKLTSDHIRMAFEHTSGVDEDDRWIRGQVIRHPNATAEQITNGLKDHMQSVRHNAIANPNATAEHITMALKDNSSAVRAAAIRHPNATAEHITKALNDPAFNVRLAALDHPKTTREQIIWHLTDSHDVVREHAQNLLPKKLQEELTNSAGGGNIAGLGVGDKGEPGSPPRFMVRRGKFAGNETFVVPSGTFHQARLSKADGKWWKKYLGENDHGREIREFALKYPKKPVILEDEVTGAMCYARYGKRN